MISAPVVEAAKALATREGIPASRILAFLQVETGGREVEPYDGRTPTLLPEPVWFYRLLPAAKRAAAVAAKLAMASGKPDYTAFAATSQQRVERLADMVAIDEEAGYGAVSLGLPQIMGLHGAELGYGSAKGLFEAFRDRGVDEQLQAMVRLWDNMGIRQAVIDGEWETVSTHWNGPNWRQNDHARKLATADAEWDARLSTGRTDFAPEPGMLQVGDHGPAVESLQRTLTKLRYVVQVDGQFGPSTEIQVVGFQKQHGIDPNGKVGPETRRAMATANPRPLGARALASMKSVAKTTAIGAKAKLAKAGAVVFGGYQVANASGATPKGIVDHIQGAVDMATRAKGTWTSVTDIISPLGQVPGGLASVAYATATSPSTLAGVGACAGAYYLAHGILRDHTADVRDGRTITG